MTDNPFKYRKRTRQTQNKLYTQQSKILPNGKTDKNPYPIILVGYDVKS